MINDIKNRMELEYVKLNKAIQLCLQIKRIDTTKYAFMQYLLKRLRFLATISVRFVTCGKLLIHP